MSGDIIRMKKTSLILLLLSNLTIPVMGQSASGGFPEPSKWMNGQAPFSGEKPQAPVSTDTFKITPAVPASTDIAKLPGISETSSQPEPAAGPGKGPWEVGSVAVKGNINVKTKVIAKTGHAKKGKLYYQDFVNSDIEAVLGLGSLEKVSVDIEEMNGKPVAAKFRDITSSSNAAVVTYIVSEKFMIK